MVQKTKTILINGVFEGEEQNILGYDKNFGVKKFDVKYYCDKKNGTVYSNVRIEFTKERTNMEILRFLSYLPEGFVNRILRIELE
jgi:hypothetical protein